MKLAFPDIRPERFFLAAGFLFGMIILFITPPFQAPDEINHFYRAWQISEGQFTGVKKDDRVGGTIPDCVKATTYPFHRLKHNTTVKISQREIMQADTMLSPYDSATFTDFPNTAIYTPVSYAPQSIVIAATRWLGLNPFRILYATRIFTLLTWLVIVYCAIRRLPGYKWLLTLLALLPMSLFANMAMSADMITNAVAFYTVSYILYCAFSTGSFSRKNLIVLCILAVLLASAKLVYSPLLLLIFIIPSEKFSSRKQYFFQTGTILLVALLTAGCWSMIIGNLYTPYVDYNPAYRDGLDLMPGANVSEQVKYIFSHDTFVLRVFLRSLKESSEMYVPGYVGTFGWLDAHFPQWFIIVSYVVILFVMLFEDKQGVRMTAKPRLLLFTTLFLLLAGVIVSQLLSWEFVGSGRVMILQGRYFIPVFPLLFIFLASFIRLKSALTASVVILFTVVSGYMTIRTIYNRYYVDPVDSSMNISCGAEEIFKYDYFVTSQPEIMLEGAATRSKENARTGEYGFRLTAANAYSAGYHFYNIQKGDSIYAEAWRYGTDAGIMLSADSIAASSGTSAADTTGWHKVTLSYKFSAGRQGRPVTVYLLSQNDSTVYFDDLEIRYIKNEAE